ncbi:uncharacterized protein JCM6883_006246 [Sporobolomyces salmoneus]|uniref:uncharacterized protein n=1 Tax=Sporobolomyces salmoneus TaxID=183962 RepID=UPI0031778E57
MFSTQQQATYSYYNFGPAGGGSGAGNYQQFNNSEGEEARWSLEDPRFVSSAEEQLWKIDEPVNYQGVQYDGKYGLQEYSGQSEAYPKQQYPYVTPQDGLQYAENYDERAIHSFDSSLPNSQFPQGTASGPIYEHYDPGLYSYPPQSNYPDSMVRPSYSSYAPYPVPPTFDDSRPFPTSSGQPDPRLLHGDQHDPTLSARYQPSFENLPTASNFQFSNLARPSSLNSLKHELDRSQSSPPRGRQSPGSSERLRAAPRRLNSNLSISIERATSTSRSSNHSPNSSCGNSYPNSPYRSLPSPLSPTRKRPHSSHYDASLAGHPSGSSSANPSYFQGSNEGGEGSRPSTGQAQPSVYEYATSSQLVENYALEQGVGELQIVSRPTSSSNAYPTARQFKPLSFDSNLPPPLRINANFEDTRRVRESEIRDYIRATDKLQAGERTVLILNPRIAQRSYGTERRLINPPPMAYILGTSWHSSSTNSFSGHLPSPPPARRMLSTPEISMSIYPPRSVEKEKDPAFGMKESHPTATWMAPDGKTVSEHDEDAPIPISDWKTMTSNAPRLFAPNDTSDVRFISKTHSWDAFIIYTVDLSIPTQGEGLIQLPAPQIGYPKPPLNIVPVDTRKAQAVYYNQPVVLQCLATGVVSPILIIRRIDTKTTVIGGGSLEPASPNVVETSHLSVAPGEKVGEPVSQYRNVAFEVYQASPAPRSDNPFDRRLPTSSFLGCMNEEIGIQVAEEEKTIMKCESPPAQIPSPPIHLRNPLYASTNSYMPGVSGFDSISEGSSDDSDSKRKRARTSTTMGFVSQPTMPPSPVSINRPTSRHKRRGQSLSSLASLQKSRSPSPRSSADLVWTVPCGESGVWSILAIDLARHTFFVPQSVDSMPISSKYTSSSLGTQPVPSTPIGPMLPSATRCEAPRREPGVGEEGAYAALYGENFDASYTIWVGDQPCSEQIVRSSKKILFRPALAPSAFDTPIPPRRISIVRFDGVVLPTNVYYRD